jgi:GntR family transcriptional regulator
MLNRTDAPIKAPRTTCADMGARGTTQRGPVMTAPEGRKTTTTTLRVSGDNAPEQPQVPEQVPQQHAPQDPDTDPPPFIGTAARRPRRRPLTGSGPKWQQIADDLRTQIEAGDLAPGDPIPSETQLTARYDVARATVRQAVQALRASGLVVVEHGRATRVRASIGISGTQRLDFSPAISRDTTGFHTWDAHGWTDVEDPSCYRTSLAQHAPALHRAPGEPVFVLERQLEHDNGTQITHRTYLPFATAATCPPLEANPFQAPADLYQALTDAGHVLHWDDATTATMPTPDEATTLEIPDGVPLIIHARITTNADDVPLILEETRLPADRATIVTRQTPV